LDGVKINRRPDGKKEVLFRLKGEHVDDLARRFKDGDAVCNVRRLKTHVSHLKQVIFGGDGAARE
jgi:hypothetical protein